MVQAGDPSSKTADSTAVLGEGDPGYTLPAEFVYPKYFHKRGALAAARTADQVNPERRSSGSQFYVVTGRIYTSAMLDDMKLRLADQRKQQLFNAMAMERIDSIQAMQGRGDMAGLQALQQELIAKTEAQYAAAPFSFTQEQIEAYTTVGGWATEVLDKFPEKGDSFVYETITVTVLEADEHRVEKLLVEIAPEEDEDDKKDKKEEE